MAERQRQADVHYRPAQRERRCGACLHFRFDPQGSACEQVEGPIGPTMCCDLWRPLKHGSRSAGVASGGAGDEPPLT